ncbi:MAG: hypothetical protein ABH837_02620 [bacterium]
MNKRDKTDKPKATPSTQAHLPIAEIVNGTVIMKDGSLRMVLMVAAVNFDLKSEKEQDALIIGFQRFLNSLEFPIQIVMQSRKINLNQYIKSLEKRRDEARNELIVAQIENYTAFLIKLLSVANIMTKKFYLVVTYIPPVLKKESIVAEFLQGVGRQVPKVEITNFNEYYKELSQRTRLVASGLNPLGLRAIQLNTQELTELYYNTYNPDTSMLEELTDTKNITTQQLSKIKSDQNNANNKQ